MEKVNIRPTSDQMLSFASFWADLINYASCCSFVSRVHKMAVPCTAARRILRPRYTKTHRVAVFNLKFFKYPAAH
jgi:hypothetical protein